MEQNIIRIHQQDAVTILEVTGDLTVVSEPFLNEAYRKACDLGARRLVLKFQENAYINSGGIALLIQLLAQARRADQAVALTGLSAHFKKIFHMVGITKFAKIHATLDEACAALNQAG